MPTDLILHHGEAVDPTLIDWIRHEIDAILGVGPLPIVIVLGVAIVGFPLALAALAARRRRTIR